MTLLKHLITLINHYTLQQIQILQILVLLDHLKNTPRRPNHYSRLGKQNPLLLLTRQTANQHHCELIYLV